jgi:hypothetical protein
LLVGPAIVIHGVTEPVRPSAPYDTSSYQASSSVKSCSAALAGVTVSGGSPGQETSMTRVFVVPVVGSELNAAVTVVALSTSTLFPVTRPETRTRVLGVRARPVTS